MDGDSGRTASPVRISGLRIEQTDSPSLVPVAPSSTGLELLVDPTNRPVWPLRGDDDRTFLKRTAQLFGGGIEDAPVGADEGRPRQHGGVVVGLRGLEGEVALYAHLTQREPLVVSSYWELAATDLPEVILSCSGRLDRELVQFLTVASYGLQATGIVWGRTRAELRSKALSSSCAALLNGPVKTAHIDAVADLDMARRLGCRTGEVYVGPDDDLGTVREALAEGAGVLVIYGHGNGESIGLPADAALCAMANPAPDADEGRAPECMHADVCFRLRKTFQEALISPQLISPDLVAARTLILTGCKSAFVGDDGIDSAWSFFPSLATSPAVGALLAAPEMAHILPLAIAADLVAPLVAGASIGRALAFYQRMPTATRIRHRLLLFGDPTVRGVPVGSESTFLTTNFRADEPVEQSPASSASSAQAKLEMFRCLASEVNSELREEAAETSRKLIETMSAYEDRMDSQAAGGAVALEKRMNKAALVHLRTMQARFYLAWQHVAPLRRLEELRRCPNCQWLGHPFEATMPGGSSRDFFVCARCGDVVDRPHDLRLAIDLSHFPHVSVKGSAIDSGCAGALYAVSRRPMKTAMYSWPEQEDGAPVAAFDAAGYDWPEGPYRIYGVFLVDEGPVSFASTTVRTDS